MKAVSPVLAALLVLLVSIAVAMIVFVAARQGMINLELLAPKGIANSDAELAWWSYNETTGLVKVCVVNTGKTWIRITRVQALSQLGVTIGETYADVLLEPSRSAEIQLYATRPPAEIALTYTFPGGTATKIYEIQ